MALFLKLQKLQDLYSDKLQVIAFPCNDFGSQEPGNNSQIALSCLKFQKIRNNCHATTC